MSKLIEPAITPTMTVAEEAYAVERARQGLAEAERGEGIPIDEFRAKVEARIAAVKKAG